MEGTIKNCPSNAEFEIVFYIIFTTICFVLMLGAGLLLWYVGQKLLGILCIIMAFLFTNILRRGIR